MSVISRRLCKCSPLHHLHIDFLDIDFLIEFGRELRLPKQLLIDGGCHGGGYSLQCTARQMRGANKSSQLQVAAASGPLDGFDERAIEYF